MSDRDSRKVRLRFFGAGDYASYFQVAQAFDLLISFDVNRTNYDLNDVLELSHAITFTQKGFLPTTSTEAERDAVRKNLSDIYRVIGRFFSTLTDSNFTTYITDIDFQYHTDVLDLLAKHKVFERCTATSTLDALRAAGLRCDELLSCKPLVDAYDQEVRALVVSRPRNAEIIISRSLMSGQQTQIYLPKSFTSADSTALLEAYVGLSELNANFLRLLATSRANKEIGLDAKLKLKAKRRLDAYMEDFFRSNEGIETGVEVSISHDQVEAVHTSREALVGKYSYSRTWLIENLDYPTILNNFIHLFQFANDDMVLTLPAYYSELGIVDRFLTTTGKEDYLTGAAFQHKDSASFLQTRMYHEFLLLQGVELEDVLAWFVNGYLQQEFGADNLRFRASSPTASYLEKCRHLFAEMESVLKQFSLYVENGELDAELLAMTSEQLSYESIPSFLDGKYVYVTDNAEIVEVQRLLFSDQSHMCWISNELKGQNFVALITKHHVAFHDFLEYQQPIIERLATYGIVDITDQVRFQSIPQIVVLKGLSDCAAVNYYHRSAEQRGLIDDMVARGWLERRSSLLTTPEKSYVNYFLNQSEFSNGPDLRNRYLHGSQTNGEDARQHFGTYVIALRLLILFAIKINDEFDLRDGQSTEDAKPGSEGQGS